MSFQIRKRRESERMPIKKKKKAIKKSAKKTRATAIPSISSIISALERCIDPELGVNIVDLGFIYGTKINGNEVAIQITLSSPMCPLAGMITDDIDKNVSAVNGVKDVSVEMVWDPPWGMEMFSEKFKKQFQHSH
jgi:metal-sulfur cluster biosynthetic enzyme